MVIRKSDFTQEALDTGIWTSLLDQAGVDKSAWNDTDLKVVQVEGSFRLPSLPEFREVRSPS